MARLSNSDLIKIPSFVLRDQDKLEVASPQAMQSVLRKSYMLIALNVIWLLIPLFGLVTGNNLVTIFWAMIIACAALFLSNIYIARQWYYNTDAAKGTSLESHFENINNIGFRTFFVTLITALAFLISSVLVTNLIKSAVGQWVLVALDLALTGILVLLGLWILKRVLAGFASLGKGTAVSA